MALTPEEMEQIPNAISNAFSELEIGIFEDLIGRIKENNEITGTAEYDIFKLIQLGESEKVIKNYVRKALKITYSEIEEIFGDVFETGYNRDNDLFKVVGADFIAYKDNEPLQQYIAAIKEQTRGTYKNITNTMGFVRQREGTNTWVPLTKYYKDSLTRAVIEITSGSFSYTQVVKKIINEMTNSGIRTIDYASGKTSRIEVAARRAIQTAVTQVAAKVTEQNMEKLHTEYVEVSWHATARPTHQVWQGRVFRWNREKDTNNKTQNMNNQKISETSKVQWEEQAQNFINNSEYQERIGQSREKYKKQPSGFYKDTDNGEVQKIHDITEKNVEENKAETEVKNVANAGESGTIKLSNREVRKKYIEAVSNIKNNIDSSLPMEEKAKMAFEARNRIRTQARNMMADKETRKLLDSERPNKTFEELIQSKMDRKGMTREEAIKDIYKTATKTNDMVNKELGLGGD